MDDTRKTFTSKFQALQDKYADGLDERIAVIEDALIVCFTSSQSRKPWLEVRTRLHDVAGSAASYGYLSLTRTARALEDLVLSVIGSGGVVQDDQVQQMELLVDALLECAKQPDDDFLGRARAAAQMGATTDSRSPHPLLIIDDSREEAQALADAVTNYGYAATVLTGFDELEAQVQAAPDVILVASVSCINDVTVATLDKVRRRQVASVPLIVISADGDLPSRLVAVDSGANAFLLKPVDIISFVNTLDQLTRFNEHEPPRVLIIDDSQALSSFYSLVLEQAEIKTDVVNDPARVIDVMNEFQPTLILMDLYMPRCSGLQLAAVLRQHESYSQVPIVYLSGEKDFEKQLQALSIGGDDFLTKPILPEHLVSAVLNHAKRAKALHSMVVRDSLTGLLNHQHTKELLDIEVARAMRRKSKLAFAMIDLDGFKGINDTYGHPAGDRVLKNLARLLRYRLRKTDIIGRYGGEEFAVVLLDISSEDAYQVMDEIRAGFESMTHQLGGEEFKLTLSCGIAMFPEIDGSDQLNDAADRALYEAKAMGKNCVVLTTT
jgi:diguanylate cyclase (GGDEF)-like protein